MPNEWINRKLAGLVDSPCVALPKERLRRSYRQSKVTKRVLRDVSTRLPRGLSPNTVRILESAQAVTIINPKFVGTLADRL